MLSLGFLIGFVTCAATHIAIDLILSAIEQRRIERITINPEDLKD